MNIILKIFHEKSFTSCILYSIILLILLTSGVLVYLYIPKNIPAKLVDLRKDKLHNHYSIIIVERDAGFYGHMFITISDYSNQSTYPKTEGYGFYAISNDVYQIVHGNTTGGVLDDFNKSQIRNNEVRYTLVLWVDKSQYDQCKAALNTTIKQSNHYKLFNNDCVSFVELFIKKLGLKAPSRLLNPKPSQYIEALFELN